jgi:acyl-CoA thioester hydrolase
MNGHVSNIEYLRWMQEAATEHTASEGWTLERYREHHTIWVVRKHTIEYNRPAFAGDLLSLHTWISSVTECQSIRRYLLTKAGERRVLASAETLWVCIDTESGRPKRVPQEFLSAFDLVEGDSDALDIAFSTNHQTQ